MANILIADAGSTKTHWAIIPFGGATVAKFSTKGINPVLQSADQISHIIDDVHQKIGNHVIKAIHFFGAGVVGEINHSKVYNPLRKRFGEAESIYVETDLKAAAIALFDKQDGIACILGTGSNSCIYQNGEIASHIPPLGFILGDEGSGAALGKRLVNNIFKCQLPEEIINDFHQQYSISLENLIENVYRKPMASAYLGSFTPFIKNNIETPSIEKMVIEEFSLFFQKNITPYQHFDSLPVGFVGSIAEVFAPQLEIAANQFGIHLTKIIKEPLPFLEKSYLTK